MGGIDQARCLRGVCALLSAHRSLNGRDPATVAIRTIRPFALHERKDLQSPVLGRCAAGRQAYALGFMTQVVQRGSYVVDQFGNPGTGIRQGDTVDTFFNEGEGHSSVRHRVRTVSIEPDDALGRREIRPTLTT